MRAASWVGAIENFRTSIGAKRIEHFQDGRNDREERDGAQSWCRLAKTNQCSIQSPHFSTCPSLPHGITGTDEVEFFGEPSMSLSEYTT